MICDKRGALGGGVLMITRLLLVAFIAFVIFGIASVFYSHYIDVRSAESVIMGRNFVDCLAPEGIFDLDAYPEEEMDKMISYCGFSGDLDRIFARVIFSESDEKLATVYQGDSGALWIREIYKDSGVKLGEGLGQYEPGYFNSKEYGDYPVFVLKDSKRVDAKMNVEVLIEHE